MSAKVTVLLPAYNAAATIQSTIQSLARQTLQQFQVLVLDDGSTDATPDIVEQVGDSRFVLIRSEKNQGLVRTLNHGLELAPTDWVARMDADDTCHPERLERQAAFAAQHPEMAVFGCSAWRQGAASGRYRVAVGAESVAARIYFDPPVIHPAAWIRKSFLDAHQLRYDPSALHVEDYDLWARIWVAGGLIDNMPDALLGVTVHANSVSRVNRIQQEYNACQIRFNLLASCGCEFSGEEQAFISSFQFSPEAWPSPVPLMRAIAAKVDAALATQRNIGDSTRLFELGRFLASCAPRTGSLAGQFKLAALLTRVAPGAAAQFIPRHLAGRG